MSASERQNLKQALLDCLSLCLDGTPAVLYSVEPETGCLFRLDRRAVGARSEAICATLESEGWRCAVTPGGSVDVGVTIRRIAPSVGAPEDVAAHVVRAYSLLIGAEESFSDMRRARVSLAQDAMRSARAVALRRKTGLDACRAVLEGRLWKELVSQECSHENQGNHELKRRIGSAGDDGTGSGKTDA